MESQYRQMTIFDMMGQEPRPSVAAPTTKRPKSYMAPQSSIAKKQEHREGGTKRSLSDWCFLYTAGRAGKNFGIRFMMTREERLDYIGSEEKLVLYDADLITDDDMLKKSRFPPCRNCTMMI